MAEQVQLHLEARLPELQDLFEKDVFTEEHIRDIVSHRTKYEYRLKRQGAILEDFLAYIEYEKQLEVERRDRVAELALKGPRTLSDHSIVEHVYGLYQRALVKFKGDVPLWTQFLEYTLLQGGRQTFSKGILKAIQVHPRHANFWIMSARFEWGTNGNMSAARTLFQQALRINPESADIWAAFFEMEVDFALKVAERRSLLGLETGESIAQDVLKGAIAITVFDHALSATPELSPSTLARYRQITAALPEQLASVREHVLRILGERLLAKPEYMRSYVQVAFEDGLSEEGLREVLQLTESALSGSPTAGALQLCVDVFLSLPDLVQEADRDALSALVHEKAIEMLSFGEGMGILTDELYCVWIELLSVTENCEDALEEMIARAVERHPKSDKLAAVQLKMCIGRLASKKELPAVIKRIARIGDESSRADLCDYLILHCSIHQLKGFATPEGAMSEIYGNSCVLITGTFGEALDAVHAAGGLQSVRKVCNAVNERRIVNAPFYLSWIAVEQESSPVDASQVRRLFQKALALDRTSEALWREFIAFERSQHCFAEAARLFEQAARAIPNVQLSAS